MESNIAVNKVYLRGYVSSAPVFSHENHNRRFYIFPITVPRLSGAEDIINIVADEEVLDAAQLNDGQTLAVTGELRSYNNKRGIGSRLVITVLAQEVEFSDGEPENIVQLTGALCKEPVYRRTPLGRDITDLMLAVSRRYNRTDYLPVIAWGSQAAEVSELAVGTRISITGRIQSRGYIKVINGENVERTAFEISAVNIEVI